MVKTVHSYLKIFRCRSELVISVDLKQQDAGYLVRSHAHRYKGLSVKITGLARLSEKYTKGVKKQAERPEFEGDLHGP